MSGLFGNTHRNLQRRFDTERLADRIEERALRSSHRAREDAVFFNGHCASIAHSLIKPTHDLVLFSGGLLALFLSPLATKHLKNVIPKEIVECFPLRGMEDTVADGNDALPFELCRNDCLPKPLLFLPLRVFGFNFAEFSLESVVVIPNTIGSGNAAVISCHYRKGMVDFVRSLPSIRSLACTVSERILRQREKALCKR